MINSDDTILRKLKPSSLNWDEFMKDCEDLINEGKFHSDEISETEDDLTHREIEEHNRPKNKTEADKHVLHVYNKAWRSRQVSTKQSELYYHLFLIHY